MTKAPPKLRYFVWNDIKNQPDDFFEVKASGPYDNKLELYGDQELIAVTAEDDDFTLHDYVIETTTWYSGFCKLLITDTPLKSALTMFGRALSVHKEDSADIEDWNVE